MRSARPFSRDPSILPAGHFRSTDPNRRCTGPSGVDFAAARPSKLFALSNDVARMLAAVTVEDCEPVDDTEFDA